MAAYTNLFTRRTSYVCQCGRYTISNQQPEKGWTLRSQVGVVIGSGTSFEEVAFILNQVHDCSNIGVPNHILQISAEAALVRKAFSQYQNERGEQEDSGEQEQD